MGNFLSLKIGIVLLFLFTVFAQAAVVPSGVPQFTFGGGTGKYSHSQLLVTPSEIKDPTTSGNYFFAEMGLNPTDGTCTLLRKNTATFTGGASGTLCFMAYYNSGGSNQSAQIVYTDNSYADNSTCSSQTNTQYQSGSSGKYVLNSGGGSGSDPTAILPILFKVPSGKYLGVQFSNGGGFIHQIRILCKDL